MRNGKFQMYDDDVQKVIRAPGRHRPSGVTSYAPARFPTRNIVAPIVLLYGDADSLVDIDMMLAQLPSHTTARRLRGYEHLDIIWGEQVDKHVNPYVVEALQIHAVRPERVFSVATLDGLTLLNGSTDSPETTSENTSTYGTDESPLQYIPHCNTAL